MGHIDQQTAAGDVDVGVVDDDVAVVGEEHMLVVFVVAQMPAVEACKPIAAVVVVGNNCIPFVHSGRCTLVLHNWQMGWQLLELQSLPAVVELPFQLHP